MAPQSTPEQIYAEQLLRLASRLRWHAAQARRRGLPRLASELAEAARSANSWGEAHSRPPADRWRAG